jgi:transcriptional regulator with XRE-family HTH domain
MEELNYNAGQTVAKARTKKHMSQGKLAEALGITRTSVSNIERGKQAMSLATFCKIAHYLHIPPHELLERVTARPQRATLLDKDIPEWVREMINKKGAK